LESLSGNDTEQTKTICEWRVPCFAKRRLQIRLQDIGLYLATRARARTSAPSERYRSAAEGPFFRLNQIVVKRRLRNFVDVAFTNFAKLKVLS